MTSAVSYVLLEDIGSFVPHLYGDFTQCDGRSGAMASTRRLNPFLTLRLLFPGRHVLENTPRRITGVAGCVFCRRGVVWGELSFSGDMGLFFPPVF